MLFLGSQFQLSHQVLAAIRMHSYFYTAISVLFCTLHIFWAAAASSAPVRGKVSRFNRNAASHFMISKELIPSFQF